MDGPNKFGYKKMRRVREEEDEVRVWEGLRCFGGFGRVWMCWGGFGRVLGGFVRVWHDLGEFAGGVGVFGSVW